MAKSIINAIKSRLYNHFVKGDYEDAYDEGYGAGHDEGFQEGLSVAKSEGAKLWKYMIDFLNERGKIARGEEYSIHHVIELLLAYERDLKDLIPNTAWMPMSTAPKGEPTEDVGCRGASEWFFGLVADKYRRAGVAPLVVIQRRAWPQDDSWRCNGEAHYIPDYFMAWRPLVGSASVCAYCDGTGDVHRADGEWMGSCGCDASAPSHQKRVAAWMQECFGPEITSDKIERADRFLEEALELAQATGWSADRGHALVDYVFARPVGEIGQEVGGVMVTLAALCNVFEVDIEAEAKREVDRITQPDVILKIRAKQAAKPTGSALPSAGASQ